MRILAATLTFTLLVAAAPKSSSKKPAAPARPATVAPDTMAHAMAMFLTSLSHDGKQRVTFKAAASGTHFFLEEPAGVTVYTFADGGYKKETFLAKTTLEKAMKQYAAKAGTTTSR